MWRRKCMYLSRISPHNIKIIISNLVLVTNAWCMCNYVTWPMGSIGIYPKNISFNHPRYHDYEQNSLQSGWSWPSCIQFVTAAHVTKVCTTLNVKCMWTLFGVLQYQVAIPYNHTFKFTLQAVPKCFFCAWDFVTIQD